MSENSTTLPPNEKAWGEDERETIQNGLPGHMVLKEMDNIRVGQWFHIACGGDVRIDNIEEETEAIIDLFDSFGIEVRIPLVGRIQWDDGRMSSVGYKVEIKNWISQGNLEDQYHK